MAVPVRNAHSRKYFAQMLRLDSSLKKFRLEKRLDFDFCSFCRFVWRTFSPWRWIRQEDPQLRTEPPRRLPRRLQLRKRIQRNPNVHFQSYALLIPKYDNVFLLSSRLINIFVFGCLWWLICCYLVLHFTLVIKVREFIYVKVYSVVYVTSYNAYARNHDIWKSELY